MLKNSFIGSKMSSRVSLKNATSGTLRMHQPVPH